MPETAEAPNTTPGTHPRLKRSYLVHMAMPFLLFAVFAILATPKRPIASRERFWTTLMISLSEVPLVLIAARARNRWFHPERRPTRWPRNSARRTWRLEVLSGALQFIYVVYVPVYIFGHKNEPLHWVVGSMALPALLWSRALDLYVEDRKYIEPDPPPPPGWSGTIGRLHSDHWGGRKPQT